MPVSVPPSYKLSLALEELSQSRLLMIVLMVLVSIPGIFNINHLLSYVVIAPDDRLWCEVPALSTRNWTDEQILAISTPARYEERIVHCKYYDYDYGSLPENISYNEAVEQVRKANPKLVNCDKIHYTNKNTMVYEWELVCSKSILKTFVMADIILGKLVGATTLGWVSDKWGRKRSLTLSTIIFIVSANLSWWAPWPAWFMILRFGIGLGGIGCYNVGFVLLIETCLPDRRQLMGMSFNVTYGVGMQLLAFLAYFFKEWRKLYMMISLPVVILIVNVCVLPESPKWLISQGRLKDVWKVVKRGNQIKRAFCQENLINIDPSEDENVHRFSSSEPVIHRHGDNVFSRMSSKFLPFVSNGELRARFLIELYLWAVTNFTYYVISLNADNFGIDRVLYLAIAGLTEVFGYVMPIPLLHYMGRSILQFILFIICGVGLLVLMLVPLERPVTVMLVAMLSRLCVTAVYAVMILHSSELFPVEVKNTALGLLSTLSNIGALTAPSVVTELGGKMSRLLPSTITGGLILFAAVLSRFLPETKHTELAYTIEEEMGRTQVSFKNCLTFG